jgi:hypothetical protein
MDMLRSEHDFKSLVAECIETNSNSRLQPSVEMITLIRSPLERLMSTMLYYHGNFFNSINKSGKPTAEIDKARLVLEKVSNRTALTVTVDEMSFFLDLFQFYFSYEVLFGQQSYEQHRKKKGMQPLIISHGVVKTSDAPEMMAMAKANLEQNFAVVGLTEQMPSLFTYMSCRYGVPLNTTCDKYITRATARKYKSFFGSTSRPKAETLFSPPVIDFLTQYLEKDSEIYEMALAMHKKQLAVYGLTIESATEQWQSVCGTEFSRKRQMANNKHVMTDMKLPPKNRQKAGTATSAPKIWTTPDT